jgi:hypothetical protein
MRARELDASIALNGRRLRPPRPRCCYSSWHRRKAPLSSSGAGSNSTSVLAALTCWVGRALIAGRLLVRTTSRLRGLAARLTRGEIPRTLHIRTRSSGRHIGLSIAIDVSSGHSHRGLPDAGLAGRFAKCLILRSHRNRLMHALPRSLPRSHIARTCHLLRTRSRARSRRLLLAAIRLRNRHCRQTRKPHKQNVPLHFWIPFNFVCKQRRRQTACRVEAARRNSPRFNDPRPLQDSSQVTNVQVASPNPCLCAFCRDRACPAYPIWGAPLLAAAARNRTFDRRS